METTSLSGHDTTGNTGQISQSPQTLEKPQSLAYQPLDSSEGEDIRLLILYPGNRQDPICCDIFHADVQSGLDYEAVSYTWATEDGDASLSQRILCSYAGSPKTTALAVTKNCASALRRIRDRNYERTLWVDAICIDQSNKEERGAQVRLMADIFSQATQVLVYLGEEDLGFGSKGLWLDSDRRFAALKGLFAKRWVSRVWVIQEVALADRVMMITGDVVFHLSDDLLNRIRARARLYNLHTPGPLAWNPHVNAATRDLLSLLHISRNCLSTDPRDKVYGLLGLVGERVQSLIKVDYTQSVEEVLTRTAEAIIVCREDLDILAYASVSQGPKHEDGSLPTWVPDWTEHRETTTLRPQFQSFELGPWRSHSQSRCNAKTKPPYLTEHDWTQVAHIPSNWDASSPAKSFIRARAHCIGAVDDITRQIEGLETSWPSATKFGHQLMTTLKNTAEPALWPPAFQWLLTYSKPQEPPDEYVMPDENGILPSVPVPVRVELGSLYTELGRCEHDKYIFRAGHLPAVATGCFDVGDTVWAVDGCNMPLILRNVGGPNYKIRGNCQLFGLWHFDCWAESGKGDKREWNFDPFRRMDPRGTQTIDIY